MKDKYEIVAETLTKYYYTFDDLAKLFCRVFRETVTATGSDKGEIKKVIYGDGSKFTLTIKVQPDEKGYTQ